MGRLQRPLAGVFSAGRSDVNPHPGNETAYSTTSASGGSPSTPGRAAKPGLHRKLTLVSGAAWFGKTTLLSAWIAGSDLPAAWLSLDEADSDPTRFPTYLVAAVRTIAPNIGDAVLADLLEKTSQPPPTESVLTTLLNDHRDYPGQFRADHRRLPHHRCQTGRRCRHVFARAHASAYAPGHCNARGSTASVGAPARRGASYANCASPTCVLLRPQPLGSSMGQWASTSLQKTSPRWKPARKGGSPVCNWPRCRCRNILTPRASSDLSPAATVSCLTRASSAPLWLRSPLQTVAASSRPTAWPSRPSVANCFTNG